MGQLDEPVSLCGIGSVSGYGWGHKLLVEGLLSGVSAARPTPGYSPYFDDDVAWVAPITDEGDPSDGPTRYRRAVRYAAREAIHNAEDRGWRPGGVTGLIHGFVLGDVDGWASFHHRRGLDATKREWLGLMPSTVLSEVALEFGIHGPTMAVTAMCASTVAGLLTAKMWINAGLADDVLGAQRGPVDHPGELRRVQRARRAVRRRPLHRDVPALPGGQPRVHRR